MSSNQGQVYFIGAGRVSLWDRDEAWYAQTSKQMLQGGDWVVPRFLDSPRYAKPILIYWCQATSMKIFGPTALAAGRLRIRVHGASRHWHRRV